ncbi:MAG: pyridoxamine 5'-phosphate oxidase family protein [Lachnospiraceae bacterium]|nr:pyridoxamine 5'-phosphate oxidase family protein [Lachnospiraceae bacterium]
MRRRDREITEFEEIIEVMERCEVCRLALNDKEYPYILPLNFGMQVEEGKIVLYFHGAKEGKKYDLIKKNDKASFEMDCSTRLVTILEDGNCTMNYESVIGRGRVEILPENEKERALDILMRHYREENFPYNKAVIPQTTVFKLTVEKCSGKRRMKK